MSHGYDKDYDRKGIRHNYLKYTHFIILRNDWSLRSRRKKNLLVLSRILHTTNWATVPTERSEKKKTLKVTLFCLHFIFTHFYLDYISNYFPNFNNIYTPYTLDSKSIFEW